MWLRVTRLWRCAANIPGYSIAPPVYIHIMLKVLMPTTRALSELLKYPEVTAVANAVWIISATSHLMMPKYMPLKHNCSLRRKPASRYLLAPARCPRRFHCYHKTLPGTPAWGVRTASPAAKRSCGIIWRWICTSASPAGYAMSAVQPSTRVGETHPRGAAHAGNRRALSGCRVT